MLEMDTLTETKDPDLAIDTARNHLGGVGEAALGLYRLLDVAQNETAHIAVTDRLANHPQEDAPRMTSPVSRPEGRQPPPMGPGGDGPGPRW